MPMIEFWTCEIKLKFRRWKQTWKQSLTGWPLTCDHDVTFRHSRSSKRLYKPIYYDDLLTAYNTYTQPKILYVWKLQNLTTLQSYRTKMCCSTQLVVEMSNITGCWRLLAVGFASRSKHLEKDKPNKVFYIVLFCGYFLPDGKIDMLIILSGPWKASASVR